MNVIVVAGTPILFSFLYDDHLDAIIRIHDEVLLLPLALYAAALLFFYWHRTNHKYRLVFQRYFNFE
ncbi:hypothetical protein JXA32_17495 [Candidatus Sumerlaeota bacterium]|nr:hypothetical protein [Candidatus Sumerlaeota bacterium]